jgi:acyl dehydratase
MSGHEPPAPRGRFFEDFTVGEVLTTGRRTITSTDIVNFA